MWHRFSFATAVAAAIASSSASQDRLTYTYDVQGRLIGATTAPTTGAATVSAYGYDKADNRTLRQTGPVPARLNAHLLVGGEYLLLQQRMLSPDNRFTFTLESSGRLFWQYPGVVESTLYPADGEALFLAMQADGNLVLYRTDNIPIWSTGTGNNPGAYLILQNDGNLVIYNNGQPLWASGTCCF